MTFRLIISPPFVVVDLHYLRLNVAKRAISVFSARPTPVRSAAISNRSVAEKFATDRFNSGDLYRVPSIVLAAIVKR
jgi:hypothetical protein